MNLGQQQQHYKAPSRTQLREARAHREQMEQRYLMVLADLNSISSAQKQVQYSPESNKRPESAQLADPLAHVSKLKGETAELFSDIPSEYLLRESHPPRSRGIQSALHIKLLENEDWAKNVIHRNRSHDRDRDKVLTARGGATPRYADPQAIVNTARSLPLSWEARRSLEREREERSKERGETSPPKKSMITPRLTGVRSSYAGLFSARKNGPADGAVNAMYSPPPEETNPRLKIEKKRAAESQKHIPMDNARKSKIIESYLKKRPQQKKVDKEFVPRVATMVPPNSARRQEIEQTVQQRHKAIIGAKPFR